MPKTPELSRGFRVRASGIALALTTLATSSYMEGPAHTAEKVSTNKQPVALELGEIIVPAAMDQVEVTLPPATTTTTAPPETTTTTSPEPPPEAPTPTSKPKPIKALPEIPPNCEDYRPLVAQYDWSVKIAMQIMSLGSGCDPNSVSPTDDHGLFQLHGDPDYDPASNIAKAYWKFVSGRVGSYNFSAWYEVCTPGPNPQPKYPDVVCQ